MDSGAEDTDGKTQKLQPLEVKLEERMEQEPGKIEGFLLKRRKRPMKGWQKRYFVLEKGMLTYGKSPAELQRGKIHGTIDIATAVITTERAEDSNSKRIDVDTEEFLYHIKASCHEEFMAWRNHLQMHKQYRAQVSVQSPGVSFDEPAIPGNLLTSTPTSDITLKAMTLERRRQSLRKQHSKYRTIGGTLPASSSHSNTLRPGADHFGLDKCLQDLTDAENSIVTVSNIIQELLNQELPPYADGTYEHSEDSSSSKKSKRRKEKSRSSKKATSDPHLIEGKQGTAIPGLTGVVVDEDGSTMRSTVSHVSLSSLNQQDQKNREEFMDKASQVHRNLKSVLFTLTQAFEKCRTIVDVQATSSSMVQAKQVVLLQENLSQVRQQNDDLRGKLARIFAEANLSDFPQVPKLNMDTSHVHLPIATQKSEEDALSRSESLVEFYDAQEYLASSASSSDDEGEEEEDTTSSVPSDDDGAEMGEEDFRELGLNKGESEWVEEGRNENLQVRSQTGRRTQLPAPQPDTSHLSLWNILKKNIGKDLSKIAMPVALNEPLSMLQVLCEELEYSELLDLASEIDDPYKRMVYVTAFAISSYSSTYYRAGTKPFNPLLGETYENIREDKGFRFISEQVSHHPPIAAVHCESKNFTYWQDVRIKTKFWGKSMEVVPIGTIHIEIPKYGDHYKFSKVTSCVHNILSGERWLDHYGETTITNGKITCKVTFTKASYWSNRRHEVNGYVYDEHGQLVHELFGKWNEGMYCGRSSSAKCVWRTGNMPEDHHLYYGFTRFAIELNEITSSIREYLPHTDSRYRPDQRLLEEGELIAAEKEKQRVESLQRERRKYRDEQGITYEPTFFRCVKESGKESWVFKNEYWDVRGNKNFGALNLPHLW
ncbi:Oxysterol-binding protein-related protein 6 [Holothuria leucospilota]|uniref:Oxysterol-binding protein n=1 Tax=Holothuria leucospilota TaxID=206669 RepID=A0A9Q0YEN1_HOLLE|nr:Oxysterol-binding protein-related protein 6 [Holothuria leucospilota]